MKKLSLIILFLVGMASAALAQSNVTLAYSIGFGTGDMGSFIGKTSFRGIAFDYRYKFQPNLAAGVSFQWNTFYEELNRDTYEIDNVALTGKQFRYSNNFPMLATVTYYFAEEEDSMVPFATLGIGTMYTRRNTDMNLYTIEREAWNFDLQPEIGVLFNQYDGLGFSASLKYNNGFAAGSELTEAQSYLSINLGLIFN